MNISVETVTSYIPVWNKNKELPEGAQVVIKHKAPSIQLYDKLVPKASLLLKIDPEGKSSGGETEMTIDNVKIFKTMVLDIKNLSFTVNDQKIEIQKAEDLFNESIPAGVSGLIDEVGAYLQRLLTSKDVDPKN